MNAGLTKETSPADDHYAGVQPGWSCWSLYGCGTLKLENACYANAVMSSSYREPPDILIIEERMSSER